MPPIARPACVVVVLVAVALALLSARPAVAQAAADDRFTGFHVGANVGGVRSTATFGTATVWTPTGYFDITSIGPIAAAGAQRPGQSGVIAGVQAGYDWRAGNLVAGIAADVDYFRTRAATSGSGLYSCCRPFGFTVGSSLATDWLVTARPRLGWLVGDVLLYGTGGLALTQVRAGWSFSDNFFTGGMFTDAAESASVSRLKAGWVAGGGAEVALSRRWSINAEYLHVDFGSVSANGPLTINPAFVALGIDPGTNPFSHRARLQSDIVRAGFSFKLD